MRIWMICCLVFLSLSACTKKVVPSELVRAVKVVTTMPAQQHTELAFSAEIRPRSEANLSFRVPGKITERLVNLGDSVKVGQVLARLDVQDLRFSQDAARAALNSTQAQFDVAQADLKRFTELYQKGFIGAAEFDRRTASSKSAKAQLEQAKAQLGLQGNQTAYANLIAPSAGVITAVDAEAGMVVAAGAPVMRLAKELERDVVFNVSENQVQAMVAMQGQKNKLQVQLWSDVSSPLYATVREIAAAADPITRTFQVKAELAPQDAIRVRLGQTANVKVVFPSGVSTQNQPKQGFLLPLSALREVQGQTHVWVVNKSTMTVNSVIVQVSGIAGNEAAISSGLKPGEQVVTAGVHVLHPNQKVKLYVPSPNTAKIQPVSAKP
jgi:membrane fusion protein, multidrug efflux system